MFAGHGMPCPYESVGASGSVAGDTAQCKAKRDSCAGKASFAARPGRAQNDESAAEATPLRNQGGDEDRRAAARNWRDRFAGCENSSKNRPIRHNEPSGVAVVESVRFGRWELSCDPRTTRYAYARVSVAGPEQCGCEPCRNFVAARMQVYRAEVLELFEKLGISANREVEVYHMGRLSSGRHLYGGWFHFVGSILSGADAAREVAENLWRPDLEPADENFSMGFTSHLALVREPFVGLALVQLEFTAEVPWVLPSPEPA
jgi:hypothetical protein